MTESNQTSIQSSLQETRRFNPPEQFQRQARVQSMDEYRQIWQRSIDDPETFWAEQADELRWQKRWDKVLNWHEPYAEWFVGGKINASENCLDRIIASGRGDKVAILFEGEPVDDDGKPVEVRNLTYNDVLAEVRQAREFVDALREASDAPVCFSELRYTQHAFDVFPSVRSQHSVRSVERFLAWALARHRGEPTDSDATWDTDRDMTDEQESDDDRASDTVSG